MSYSVHEGHRRKKERPLKPYGFGQSGLKPANAWKLSLLHNASRPTFLIVETPLFRLINLPLNTLRQGLDLLVGKGYLAISL
jgi:hypothetical protein